MIKLWLVFAWNVLRLAAKHARKRLKRLLNREARIELRDAMTGEKLGMTKREFKKYMLALGTKDHRQIMKAKKEMQARKHAA